MAVVALGFVALWACIAIGWRGWLHWRRTGASAFVGGAGADGRLVMLGLAPSIVGPVLDLAGTLPRVVHSRWLGAGGALMAAGAFVVAVWAQVVMGDAWRIGVDPSERTTLIRSGPFRVARNPIYTAMIVFFVGLALMVPNVASIVWAVVVAVGLDAHVRLVEEPYLRSTHGHDYHEYASTTGRFLPDIGRLA